MAAATLRSVLRRNSLLPLFETCHLRDLLFFSSSVGAAAAAYGGTMSPDSPLHGGIPRELLRVLPLRGSQVL
ncbi:hypothetical protein C4D60_Mb10t06540 [Musa balbisiana]|uniref:Uncharacterized protein n=1 Tax=Musa balbisiana TaxID=52838 RepID=A0A4V4H4M8_MUSBA|nr:hypothetical protein C4D60_Mb10t06540 [Musa balbisiana]